MTVAAETRSLSIGNIRLASPVVLALECNGIRLTVTAAPSSERDDEIVVEPIKP